MSVATPTPRATPDLMGDILELAALACLTAFAGTFGVRWFLLALGIALLVVAVGGVNLPRPRVRAVMRRHREAPYGVVRGRDL